MIIQTSSADVFRPVVLIDTSCSNPYIVVLFGFISITVNSSISFVLTLNVIPKHTKKKPTFKLVQSVSTSRWDGAIPAND